MAAKRADGNLKVFGASRHQYHLNQPVSEKEVLAFEKKYDVQLPLCYKAFLTEVGNGGNSFAHSAAGPFYGIYPLGENVDELIYENTEKYLKQDCVLYPKMTQSYWKELTRQVEENEAISDEDFEKELGKIYGGILPIGSQGCTYIHGIVLNGPYKGRIVNLDIDRQKPHFAFENNFLDWYERWLDEVISGELIRDSPSWFGYVKGGSEEKLLAAYVSSKDADNKQDNLAGLLNKPVLKDGTLDQIEEWINEDRENKITFLQMLCKSSYERAKPYLLALVDTDLRSVFQVIHGYAKEKSHEWLPMIERSIHRVSDMETFRFCTYILYNTDVDYGAMLLPFTQSANEKIRSHAFYSIGRLPNKKRYLPAFIEGLNDSSNQVIHSTLQALSGVKDDRLLEHFKKIAEKFPVEQDYILSNLNHRLAEYGLDNQSILKRDAQTDTT